VVFAPVFFAPLHKPIPAVKQSFFPRKNKKHNYSPEAKKRRNKKKKEKRKKRKWQQDQGSAAKKQKL